MQSNALQGFFKNGIFYHEGQPVYLPEGQMVEIHPLDAGADLIPSKKASIEWWNEFLKMIAEDDIGKLSMNDFTHMSFGRELISFDDED
ncbi:MAG: hypothetical protein FWB74_07575 [Defluviitaleaceae bacterium]|nr:hypothetical protein [Defluviitaleaceae bacterium]